MNLSGGGTFKRAMPHVCELKADMVLVQEHKAVSAEQRHQLRSWGLGSGYKTVMDPALTGPNGGPSSGVGLCCLKQFGVREPEGMSRELVPGRLTCVTIAGMVKGGFDLYSLYAETGSGWQEGVNLTILHQLALAIKVSSRPFVVGGDWQLQAAHFQRDSERWLRAIRGVVIQPPDWTCNVGDSYTTIDFFVVHESFHACGAHATIEHAVPSKRTGP